MLGIRKLAFCAKLTIQALSLISLTDLIPSDVEVVDHLYYFLFLFSGTMLMLMSKVHLVWSLYLGRWLFLFYFILLTEYHGILTAVLCFWCLGSPKVWKAQRKKWNGNFDVYFFLNVAKEVGENVWQLLTFLLPFERTIF